MKLVRRILRHWLLLSFLVPLAVVVLLPWLLSVSPARNRIVALVLGDAPIEITSERAWIGWVTPLSIEGLTVRSKRGAGEVSVGAIRLERSPVGMWWNRPDLGELRLEHPRCDLALDTPWIDVAAKPEKPDDPDSTLARNLPQFRLVVKDASVTLRQSPHAQPFLMLEPIQVALSVDKKENGAPVLRAAPIEFLQRRPLAAQDFQHGLELVVPILASSTQIDGEVSLRLDELEIPYGETDPKRRIQGLKVDGHLVLHEVAAGLRNPMLLQIAGKIAGFFNAQVPQRVKFAHEADIHFRVAEGRVIHEGFKFGLPEIAEDLVLATSGSVGLDRTLDLIVEVPLGGSLLAERPWLRRVADKPLRLSVTGTIEEPKVGLAQDRTFLEELAQRLLPPSRTVRPASATDVDGDAATPHVAPGAGAADADGVPLDQITDAVIDGLGELLKRRRERKATEAANPSDNTDPALDEDPEPTAAPLLERLRSRLGNSPPRNNATPRNTATPRPLPRSTRPDDPPRRKGATRQADF